MASLISCCFFHGGPSSRERGSAPGKREVKYSCWELDWPYVGAGTCAYGARKAVFMTCLTKCASPGGWISGIKNVNLQQEKFFCFLFFFLKGYKNTSGP